MNIPEVTSAPVSTPKKKDAKPTYLIDLSDKRVVKSRTSGQVIEALRRSKNPLSLKALASRVRGTKSGKDLEVKDLATRVTQCAKWWEKHTDFVAKTEKGEFYLVPAKKAE